MKSFAKTLRSTVNSNKKSVLTSLNYINYSTEKQNGEHISNFKSIVNRFASMGSKLINHYRWRYYSYLYQSVTHLKVLKQQLKHHMILHHGIVQPHDLLMSAKGYEKMRNPAHTVDLDALICNGSK